MIKEYLIKLDPIEGKEQYNIYYLIDGIEESKQFYADSLDNIIGIIEQGYTKHVDSL